MREDPETSEEISFPAGETTLVSERDSNSSLFRNICHPRLLEEE